jgi:protein-S-isoprenylcysteine O-methyltransferase Ste14
MSLRLIVSSWSCLLSEGNGYNPAMRFLETVGWVACCVYATIPSFWLLIHPRTEKWRERVRGRRPVYKILVPVWVGMWVAAAGVTGPWRNLRLYDKKAGWIVGVVLIGLGIFFYVKARHGFSPLQLSGHHELEPDRHEQKLVVTGVRQHVRHPIYLGHLLEMIGWSVGTGLAVCWTLTAFAVITGVVMIRLEERELVERFGESYREYQKRVSAIVPR